MTTNAPRVFARLAAELPEGLHPHVLVVGSVAAAYAFADKLAGGEVTTKDADVIVQPAGDVDTCQRIAERLFEAGWEPTDKCTPSPSAAPVNELRAVRLWPKESRAYFVELLGLPQADQMDPKVWVPIRVRDGWYGVPCFRYMGLAAHAARTSGVGLRYADPAMMALANLLAHPALDPTLIAGTEIRRSAKDLGRVLALAWLEGRDGTERWPALWKGGLDLCFPQSGIALAAQVAIGLRALLEDPAALDEAILTMRTGLLAGVHLTHEVLRTTAARLELDVFGPFVKKARG